MTFGARIGVALFSIAAVVVAGCSKTDSHSRMGASGVGVIAPGSTAQPRPSIEVISPAPGSFLTTHNQTVEGKITDPQGLAIVDVEVNGQPANFLPDGTFDLPVQMEYGMNRVTVRAVNSAGLRTFKHVGYMCGSYRQDRDLVPDALHGRINAPAWVVIDRALEAELNTIDLNAALQGLNPVYVNQWVFGLVSVKITDPKFSDPFQD